MIQSKSNEELAQEVDRVLGDLISLDDEARDYLRPLVLEELLESMRPENAVLEHIQANHELTRDYVFPDGSGDDEAMFLLQHRVTYAEESLRFIMEAVDPPCEHRPRTTGGAHPSPMFTLKERVADALETLLKYELKKPSVGESNPGVEAAVVKFMERFSEVENEDYLKLIADAYRDSILRTTDPQTVIRRRLSRYKIEDGILEIPEEQRLDQALRLLLIRHDYALTSLNVIATRELSCGDHHVIYAGGIESEGNRIFTAQRMAKDALEGLENYLLEPKPVAEVLMNLLEGLGG